MESVFPGLFFLSYFAPVIVRVALGLVFLYEARELWKQNQKPFAGAALILGVLVGCGLFTQPAAIVGGIYVVGAYMRMKTSSVFGNAVTAFLSMAILLLLLVSGPGGLAFDLPY
jgi:uncharacterized membrane protein YphA (DoxX/SURF4 family)